MYHIVYLTTNIINQKIYIGVHSTWNLNDGYLGSGSGIKNAIKRYSKENFTRDILYYCLTREDAFEIEGYIVNRNFIRRKNVYNNCIGGIGYYIYSEEIKKKMSENRKNIPSYRKGLKIEELYSEKICIQIRERGKILAANRLANMTQEDWDKFRYSQKDKPKSEEHKNKISKGLQGKSKSIKAKQKMSEKAKIRTEEHRRKISESNKNSQKIKCPYCNKMCDVRNFGRWHADKCKFKEE